MIDLDEILIHAHEHGEALLYTPPRKSRPVEYELVPYRAPAALAEPRAKIPQIAPHAPK